MYLCVHVVSVFVFVVAYAACLKVNVSLLNHPLYMFSLLCIIIKCNCFSSSAPNKHKQSTQYRVQVAKYEESNSKTEGPA